MATATIVTDLTEITDCDSETTSGGIWSGLDVSEGSSDPPPLEGIGWIGGIIKQADDSNTVTFTPTTAIDMSTTHIRLPLMTVLTPLLKTKANGGIQIILTGTTSGTATFNVSGGDFYTGGWEILTCNPYATPDEGTQVVGNVDTITLNFKILTAAKNIITCWFDWMSYGTGFYVHGGTSGDEITMSHIDIADVYYLLNYKQKGVYYLSGKFQIGDDVGTNTTYFKDSGQIFIFEDLDVDSTLYELVVAGNSTGTTVVDLSGNFISTVIDNYIVDFTDDINVTSILLNGTVIQKAGDVFGSSIVDGTGTVFDQCGMLELDDSIFDNSTVQNGTETADLLYPATDNMTNMKFVSSGTGHAILIETTGTKNMDNFIYSGYASSDGSTGNECIFNDSGGAVTINVLNGGDTPTIRNGTSATTTVVNAVTLKVTASDSTGNSIVGVRILLEAGATGNAPYLDSVTITSVTTTASVSHTAHGLSNGNSVVIRGANETEYNGKYTISNVSTDAYDYTFAGSVTSPATGTITSSQLFMSELTITDGIAEESFNYNGVQSYIGSARKSSSSPYYKLSTFSGNIGSTGIDIPVQLIGDE